MVRVEQSKNLLFVYLERPCERCLGNRCLLHRQATDSPNALHPSVPPRSRVRIDGLDNTRSTAVFIASPVATVPVQHRASAGVGRGSSRGANYCGPQWPYGGFAVTGRSRNRGASVLSQGPCITHRSSAAEDYTGRPLAQSSGAALASTRARCVAQSQNPQLKVSEQHRRTRSSSDRAKVRAHARLQVIGPMLRSRLPGSSSHIESTNGRGRPRVGASLRTIWDRALTP
jgi:hypothetical protein